MRVEGRNPVIELLKSGKPVKKLYLQNRIKQDTKINTIIKRAKKSNIRIIRKSKKKLDQISSTGSHQGIIAMTDKVDNISFDEFLENYSGQDNNLKLIYIREAYHEHNIGAIIRTAESAGFNAVILPPKINMTPQIIRASMGASEHIHIFNESLFPFLKKCKEELIKIVGIEQTENSILYTKSKLTGNILLIIGGEDRPLSNSITNKCDIIVKLPQHGKVNSLNMSVAAAIIMYEVLRQTNN
ncbi:23S rRNA (guanosine(2251)-2'-O)-methyltransferase RlmB [Candidatus Dojkabacteria bacterium]|nr:23S rRNA (guanosine(2251)-2'-O)-methyltransferase RlmB [Candidatus Dojkabacteria bacterium]